jgi:hypothetical protein
MNVDVLQVARICHETNRAYCESIGDTSQKPWDEAEPWQRKSAACGVQFKLENPRASPSDQHDAWSTAKLNDGWIFGAVKDPVAKTHPCLVAYSDLPLEQRIKDYLFGAIVSAFVSAES